MLVGSIEEQSNGWTVSSMGGGGGIGDLSQDVLVSVLSRLNAPDAFRASAVCRQWNAVVQSLHVKFSQSSPDTPYCMRIREDCRQMELYGLKGCMRISLDFLAERYVMLALLACGGGLLLFRADFGVLVVCNPVSREFHELPPLDPPLTISNPRVFPWLQHPLAASRSSPLLSPREPWCSKQDDKEFQRPTISVIVPTSNHRRAAKIFLSGYKDERVGIAGSAYDFRTRLYDLSTKSWTPGGVLPVKDFRSTDGVYLGSQIYTVTGMWQKSAVISYDLESDGWSDLPVGVPPSVMHPYLVQHGDSLLLIGACSLKDGLPLRDVYALTAEISSFSIRIWQLSECRTRWDEVARMPQEVYDDFVHHSAAWFWFECIGRGNILYFAEKTRGIPQLAYDFATDQWQPVPKMAENKSGVSYSKQLFLYHPSPQPL